VKETGRQRARVLTVLENMGKFCSKQLGLLEMMFCDASNEKFIIVSHACDAVMKSS
jgi:hypothetical protein